jgi:RluA family pseudouridine synthase
MEINPEILYQNEDLIVINKPAGVLTLPDRYIRDSKNLYNWLQNKYEQIFTVHRLDRETSGVIVFARNAEAHRFLNQQFQESRVKKIYHAVTGGVILQDEIDIDIALMPDADERGKTIPSIRGKASLSRLKVLERYRNATLVQVDLVTGRHHQLRVHCASIGNPLLVDGMYGGSTEFLLSSIKKRYNLKKHETEKPIIGRLTMHAYSISFEMPVTGEQVNFTAEYPRDFEALLQVLRKYSKLPDYYRNQKVTDININIPKNDD